MPRDALKKYNEMRDFHVTDEPHGKVRRKKKEGLLFVIQKHDATRLHYDFRLEIEGVLASWAVPKGPSYNPQDKRLAVRTEDHPVSYADFEGVIPPEQYGAGPVMLWDTGTWRPLGEDPVKALKNGKLSFEMDGEKMQGAWTLARMNRKDDGRENWLLIKNKDEEAAEKTQKDFLKKTDYSVKTGKEFKEIAAANKEAKATKEKQTKTKNPDFQKLEKKYKGVQLATLVDDPPGGDGWVHEVKYDGYRILAFVKGGHVRIRTRNGHDWTDRFPVLKQALENVKAGDFIIDGEAVMLDENGLSSFKNLQNGLDDPDAAMRGYFFDLVWQDGKDFLTAPFSKRRAALEKLFKKINDDVKDGPLYLSETLEGKADKIIGKACDLGLEGIISKKKNASYTIGRSRSWQKSKCEQRQEFIICGFVPASDLKNAIGALHLGYYDDKDRLVYAGKVGTGFGHDAARDLYKKLKAKERKTPPFDKAPGRHNKTIWVTPELLCEVKFAMWTQAGKIRHASYQGLRADKKPEEITKEMPKEQPNTSAKKSGGDKSASQKTKGATEIAGVRISHPDREIFPEAKITKADLARFYADMADLILPGIEKRPISVVRCPGGIDKECFFQRSKGKGMPDSIHVVDIKHEGKSHEYFYIKDVKGLVALVQFGAIEIHPWGAAIDITEKPDRIIFDLDPDEGIPFEAIKLAAQDVRKRLENIGLESFLKVTGGKGLHVDVPISRRHEWDDIKTFARNFAAAMAKDVPDAYTINMAKKKRTGKIFLDYLRNDFANTAIMDYGVRARKGAPVAVPLEWEELQTLESANAFHPDDARNRHKKGAKLLKARQKVRQSLTASMIKSLESK